MADIGNNPFSRKLNRFLFSSKNMSLLPGYGWNDGGCWTLAQAMHLWSGGKAELKAVYSYITKNGRPIMQHVVVQVPGTELYLDADGILTGRELLVTKMEEAERVPRPYIDYFRKELLRFEEIELLERVSEKMAKRLEKRFGKFEDLFIL